MNFANFMKIMYSEILWKSFSDFLPLGVRFLNPEPLGGHEHRIFSWTSHIYTEITFSWTLLHFMNIASLHEHPIFSKILLIFMNIAHFPELREFSWTLHIFKNSVFSRESCNSRIFLNWRFSWNAGIDKWQITDGDWWRMHGECQMDERNK